MADERLNLFVPITKVDADKRLVYGTLAEEAIDKSGEVFDYAGSKAFFQEWSDGFAKATGGKSKGNLREMHTNHAAGKFVDVVFDDDGRKIDVVGKVVDDSSWKKTIEGVLTGFSIGGDYVTRKAVKVDGRDVVRYTARPSEGSLVDNPCMYGATFDVVKGKAAPLTKRFGASLDDCRKASDGLAKLVADVMAAAPIAKLDGHDVALVMNLETLRAIGKADVTKDGAAAVGAADQAIADLKSLLSELALLEGEPDTLALQDTVDALRSVLWARVGAEAAEDQEEATMTAAPAPTMAEGDAVAASAKTGGTKKAVGDTEDDEDETDDADGETEGDDSETGSEGGDTPSDAAESDGSTPPDGEADDEEDDEEDDDAAKAVGSFDRAAVVEAVKAVGIGLAELSKLVAKGQADGKSAASKATEAMGAVQKAIDDLSGRLAAIEAQPVKPGRPARKTIGEDDQAEAPTMKSVAELAANVDALKKAGVLSATEEASMRSTLARLSLRNQ